jgi:hypothetical protein
LQNAIRYDADSLSEERVRLLSDMRDRIIGSDASTRLNTVLATPRWDLEDSGLTTAPQSLVDLADEVLAALPDSLDGLRNAVSSAVAHPETVYSFGYVLGVRDGKRVVAQLLDSTNTPLKFAAGYLRGWSTVSDSAVDEVLDQWMADNRWAGVLYASQYLEATPTRVSRILEASAELSRRGEDAALLEGFAFGSWLGPLALEEALPLMEVLVARAEQRKTFSAIDAALFALWSYIGENPGRGEALQNLAKRAVELSLVPYEGGRDLTHLRNSLLEKVPYSPTLRLETLLSSLERKTFPAADDLDALRSVLPRLDDDDVIRIIDWLASRPFEIDLYLQNAHLLSILEDVLGGERLLSDLRRRSGPEVQQLVAHLDWTGDPPRIALQLLTESPDLDEEVTRRFLFPGEIVVGKYSSYLKSRRAVLERIAAGEDGEQIRAWARELIPDLDKMIAAEERREAEMDTDR